MSIRNWLAGRKRDEPVMVQGFPIRRVAAADNPCGVELWDISLLTQGMISTTADPAIAESFLDRRSDRGELTGAQPIADSREIPGNLAYQWPGEPADGPLFRAEVMEEKWDIYLYRPHLTFARSWTGELDLRATVALSGGTLSVSRIEFNNMPDDEYARRVVDYLIRSHLLGERLPHPLPEALVADPTAIPAYSFSMFGRLCHYGTYADTIGLKPVRLGGPGADSHDREV